MNEARQQKRDPMQHPLLRKLNDLMESVTGLRFVVVRPHADGWQQISPGGQGSGSPVFCRLIRSSPEGVTLCKMCHILLASAADGGLKDQTCHAGAHILLGSRSSSGRKGLAILSSCMFFDAKDWSQAESRAQRLKIDRGLLKKAFDELPRLTDEQLAMARLIIDAALDAVEEVCGHTDVKSRLAIVSSAGGRNQEVRHYLQQRLSSATGSVNAPPAKPRRHARSKPLLIKVVEDLINNRPDIPLTVASVAAVAHVTPNHLSMIFRRHTGRRFMDYLTDRRIDLAKRLLRDLSLNISDVAERAGFTDAGYFTRRFRQKTRLSPREWRQRLEG
ncbi:MAG: helix-turn-helix domain-containing protein [bacterium]